MGNFGTWFNLILIIGIPTTYGVAFQATDNQTQAVALTVIYIVAGAIAKLTEGVWTELSKRWSERIANKIDLWVSHVTANFQSHYHEPMWYQHRNFDVKGFSTQGPHTLELERVFVQLQVASTVPSKAEYNPIPVADELEKGQHDIWEFLQSDQSRSLVIIGPPGSGKTTLMRFLALYLCGHTEQKNGHDYLPILLFLSDHAKAIAKSHEEDTIVSLADLVNRELKEAERTPPEKWIRTELKK